MKLKEELKSGGVYPTGPVSAWPQERNEALMSNGLIRIEPAPDLPNHKMPTIGAMAKNLAKTTGQAIMNGKTTREIRDERYATCQACPAFNPESERCSECGCFMKAKTWIAADKDLLCPLKKWER